MLNQTAYARGAHIVHSQDDRKEVSPFEDRSDQNFGVAPSNAHVSQTDSRVVRSPQPMLRGTPAELRHRRGTDQQTPSAWPAPPRSLHLRGSLARAESMPSLAQPIQEDDEAPEAADLSAERPIDEDIDDADKQFSKTLAGHFPID